MPIEQTTRFELVSVNGPVVEIASTISQTAAPGTVVEVAGMIGTIERWEVTGRGALTRDLTGVVPRGTLTVVSDQAFSISIDDRSTAAGLVMNVSVRIAPADPGG